MDGGISPDDVEVHTVPLHYCARLNCFRGPAPPTVWIGLRRAPEFEATDLSPLRKGYYGASPMPVESRKDRDPTP